MKKFVGVLALAAAVLGGALVIGVQRLVPRQIDVAPAAPIHIDAGAAARRLSAAIQLPTVSFEAPESSNSEPLESLRALLTSSFPQVHSQLTREVINGHSLLYTWRGKDPRLKPILLMAHMDVVPVDPASEPSWTYPPFSGTIADGFIWGRGSMDDKASVLAILEAVEHLLSEGFQPARTIYLAFGHDEETGGAQGAAKIAELLAARKVELEFVLDEGMNIFNDIISGVAAPVALIGVAEKGYLSVEINTQAAGGHSSIPPADNAITRLSRALQRIAAVQFPATLRQPTRAMLEHLGPETSWPSRIAIANLWLFEPLIANRLAQSPLTNALLRTTLAPTRLNAGVKDNVLPATARAVVNLRIAPGETIAATMELLRKSIDDPMVQLSALPTRMEPSPITDSEGASYKTLARTIRQTAPEAIVAPSLLVGATDSRHYAGLTKNVLRFLPITITQADTSRYHGVDERIALTDYRRCINFYAQLIRNSDHL